MNLAELVTPPFLRRKRTIVKTDYVRFATFCTKGNHFLTISDNDIVTVYDASSGTSLSTFVNYDPDIIFTASFNKTSDLIVITHGNQALMWDFNAKVIKRTLTHENFVLSASFGPSNILLTTTDQTVNTWQPDRLFRQTDTVNRASFNSTATRFIVALDDATATINGGEKTITLHHLARVTFASFDPTDTRALTASDDKTAKVWKAETGELTHTIPLTERAYSAAFDAAGVYILTLDAAGIVKISGEQEEKTMHIPNATSAAFNITSTRILIVTSDNCVHVRDINGNPCGYLRRGGYVNSASFDPTGQFIITASDDYTATVSEFAWEDDAK